MRQIKIIGLVLLLFVCVFPFRDHQTDSGHIFYRAAGLHTIPYPNFRGVASGFEVLNRNNAGCESAETVLLPREPASIQNHSITNLVRDKKNKVSPVLHFNKNSLFLLFLLFGFAGNAYGQIVHPFNADKSIVASCIVPLKSLGSELFQLGFYLGFALSSGFRINNSTVPYIVVSKLLKPCDI